MTDSLYSINGSHPSTLPFLITLSDGRTRTDPSTFTPEEIADAGYVETPDRPEYDPATQQLGWDGENWTLTPIQAPVLTRISKYDLIMRLTDEEADQLLADFNDAPGKLSLLWNSILYVDKNDPAYPTLQGIVTARLGEARAAEVLEPME